MIRLSYHARRAAKGFAVFIFLILGASTLRAEEANPALAKTTP
jgi:hypothetical protein